METARNAILVITYAWLLNKKLWLVKKQQSGMTISDVFLYLLISASIAQTVSIEMCDLNNSDILYNNKG